MNISVLRRLLVPAVLLPLLTAVGCSSPDSASDSAAKAAVPAPDAAAAKACRKLHPKLPERVDGLDRNNPAPKSELTAGWGDPAIILRCGVPRPAALDDPKTDGVEVDGVDWAIVHEDGGPYRLYTTLRIAYVEVTIPAARADNGLSPLTDFAKPVTSAIPKGIAEG
ncbi:MULTISPECIES: DUF3515 domain-containing protein [unclassified Streptomyces]|uniref:DUF3515 domain-containing protein n=1 Tax=Streptomyces evansiae TaxID=3075535 RepID=A0ABD5E830_9ACTN|nr:MULTISPECIES: DUF3515 domain-containing protein [unclassified Streptomyces]MYQ60603.1 DUF3515 family protein [Streptomyces sp. SID4926]MYX22430.1 DUF3515 family protein [Streptomyces sp. SID8380]ASY32600.1 hypothetical protein CAC01_07740 [Streptomyces sp. CLI2509]EGJ74496.1 hypothetical protein STTU_1707 [Streptomyces sp. Tu6071]MDT0409506.1 DUF3515 domain-containing protein [Streptomyces sp. DSM 41979]